MRLYPIENNPPTDNAKNVGIAKLYAVSVEIPVKWISDPTMK